MKYKMQLVVFLGALTTGCGPSSSGHESQQSDASGGPDGLPQIGDGGSEVCDLDVLILLDRTLTMVQYPEGGRALNTPEERAKSKWAIAIDAIERFALAADDRLHTGLALFPQAGPGCLTIEQCLSNPISNCGAANAACQSGELLVPPQLAAAALIDTALDHEVTPLCYSTPTGSGLQTTYDALLATAAPDRSQFVVLVTDGVDFNMTCPNPVPFDVVSAGADSGILTYMIGLGTEFTGAEGVNPSVLNRLACAGRTAHNFETACEAVPGGYDAIDPNGAVLYFAADDSNSLADVLVEALSESCSDIIVE